jgi:hypothetical protein
MKHFICPNQNCGYQGAPKRRSKGSWVTLLLLLVILPLASLVIFPLAGAVFVVVGLLYMLANGGYRYDCPKCGIEIRR